MTVEPAPIRIYVDADACPVKDEIYRVAGRHRLPVFVVTNSFMRVPQNPSFHHAWRLAPRSGAPAAREVEDFVALLQAALAGKRRRDSRRLQMTPVAAP